MTALSWDHCDPTRSGYVNGAVLHALVRTGQTKQSWWLGSRLVSVQLAHRRIYKNMDRLKLPALDLLDDLEAAGVYHPASFGDCYHQLAGPPDKIRPSLNNLFEKWPGGPWEEARLPGVHPGPWWRYDLVSAYRWASTLGLPDPRTYRIVRRFTWDYPGIWVVRLPMLTDMPPCHRTTRWVVCTTEELQAYGVEPTACRVGVIWTATRPHNAVTEILDRLPFPANKHAGRAYWGRWAGRDPLVCRSGDGTARILKNNAKHLVWAWLIVARVRLKLWRVAGAAAHVYVDEIVTREQLPTGPNPGDWHLKAEYPDGIFVDGTGWWGVLKGRHYLMHTGQKEVAA